MPKLRLSPVLLVMNLALIVYGLSALLSLKTAYDRGLTEGTVAAVVGSVGLFFALVVILRRTERNYVFAALLGILGTGFSLFFISQFKYQNYVETPAIISQVGTITSLLPNLSTFIHPNSAATMIELLLPIVLALLLMARDIKKRTVWIAALGVLGYAFLLTYSRGAYLGLAVALTVGLVAAAMKRLSSRQALLLLGAVITVAVVLMVGLVVVGPRVPFVASLLGVTASRLEIYRNSLVLASDYAFTGIGLGDTFAMVYSRYSLLIFVPLFTYTHNLLLAILLGQGVVGLAAFVVVVIMFYLFVLRVLWVVRISHSGVLFYGSWIGVTATLVHGLTDARQYVESPFNLPLLFVAMALTISCGIQALRMEAFENPESKKIRGWYALGVATVGLIVALVGGYMAFNKPLMAAWHTNLGALDEARSDSTLRPIMFPEERKALAANARSEYEQALAIDPDNPNANRRLGNIEVDHGAFEAAIPLLEKAYAAEPNYQASIKGLGLAYLWVGRTQEAACLLNTLPDVSEMVEELYSWQNFRHEQQQDLLSAYALETAAIMEDYQQTNMDVWVLIGDRYRAADQPEPAQIWYSRVLNNDANNTAALDGLKTLGLEPITIEASGAGGCAER